MRAVIYGAGGIGGGIGALLAAAGHDVTLIARGEHLEAVRSRGLRVQTPEWSRTFSLAAVGHPRELDLRGDEVFFFTMKSQDTLRALDDLRDLAPDAPVVLAQNGVANERMARRRFDRVYAMLVFMPAQFLEAGTIALHATPRRGTLHAGVYPRGTDDRIVAVCRDLRAAGFESDPDGNVMRLKYGKLLTNLGNAVQALCGLEADVTRLAKDLRDEGMRCLEAAGIAFVTARELVERCRAGYGLGEIEGQPRLGGSSWQGAMRGRRSTETDFLNGEVVLLGADHGVPTPLNRAVQRLAHRAVREGLAPGRTSVEAIYAEAERAGAGADAMRGA
jgi:2-dehydropantoate 2-reductase